MLQPLLQQPEKQAESARANILGVGVSAINLDLAVAAVAQALERKAKGYVCVTGVHGVSEAQQDAAFRAILNHSFLTTPDGMPTVWMGRWQGFREMRRVYGPDLMLRICEFTQARGFSHFLYGGAPGVAETLKSRLEARFPGLSIVGTYTPPFRPLTGAEEQTLAGRVAELKPDIFWVGLSTHRNRKGSWRSTGRNSMRRCFSVSARLLTFMLAGCGRRLAGCSAAVWSGCFVWAATRAGYGNGI